MRTLIIAAILLASCNPAEQPPPLPASTASSIWFICDGVDAPSVFALQRVSDAIELTEYDKPNGALVARDTYALGEPEGAAGSVYTPLLRSGVNAGAVRETNSGMLETPGAAYTPRITEVRLGERAVTCRWLPRTRLFGVTGRRSFVVHEDADGDLIYTTFDFATAPTPPIELSENGVSTSFSVEARGGEEIVSPDGVVFRFQGAEGYAYVIATRRDGGGELNVTRGGEIVQTEELAAFQLGNGG